MIIPSCKIHTVDGETLGRGPKDGRIEEIEEEEWVSFNILNFRKTKIWQDYSTSIELKRGEEMRVFMCLRIDKMRVYIVVVEKIWTNGNLMRVNKKSWT